ncbi:MAG: class I SAM-dependent methyltransferase [Verrucomicrobia bacterium]|nr:class I SAM-dependent methyltransferase [Verrucomicrobiota bacterium]MDA1069133.1 class I SAM-dependent methyltransferase [Verrucomicrobiota bacterium]
MSIITPPTKLTEVTTAPDYAAIKTKQQAAWATGDYSVVGVTLQIVGEQLCETLDLRSGQRLLDVAAGNGNVSLAAARRFCDVVSTDYVPELLERGQQRAQADCLSIEFQTADAENLPFESESFDVVTSSFGVMFAPDQTTAASEMLRVCRSGGKIGMANWTPGSFIGHLFKTIGKHLPPPVGLKSPALWGTRERLEELFSEETDSIDINPQVYVWRYKSAQHWLAIWRNIYGPLNRAFAALSEDKQAALEQDLLALIEQFNVADDGTMVVPSDYVEVVVTKS